MLFASLRGGRGQGISVVTTGNAASAYGLQVFIQVLILKQTGTKIIGKKNIYNNWQALVNYESLYEKP